MLRLTILLLTAGLLSSSFGAEAPQEINDRYLRLGDVFDLEYASDPQISPKGSWVVYERNFFDIMTDRRRSNLWIVHSSGSGPRAPLHHRRQRRRTPLELGHR